MLSLVGSRALACALAISIWVKWCVQAFQLAPQPMHPLRNDGVHQHGQTRETGGRQRHGAIGLFGSLEAL